MNLTTRTIFITEYDRKRLQGIISTLKLKARPEDRARLVLLDRDLDQATVVPSEHIPSNVITMNSRFRLRMPPAGESRICRLVFPGEADGERGLFSVLSPLGSALIGRKSGDLAVYKAPGGPQEVLIEEILFQPEASGDYLL